MNADGRTNPRAEFTAARAEGQSDPRRHSNAKTEPISCEDRAGGGSARSFKSSAGGEEQLCSASGGRRSCWVSADGGVVRLLFRRDLGPEGRRFYLGRARVWGVSVLQGGNQRGLVS